MNKITKLSLSILTTISLNTTNAQVTLPITFEAPGVTYTMVDFDGGTTSLVPNPSSGGINTSFGSLRMVKNAGQPWGGTKITLASAINFTTNNTFKMKVYSPRANCPVLFKIEGANGVFVERTAYTSVINTWEDLSWDFTGVASNTYTDLVFIYDLGVMCDGSSNFTFFQDDIRLVNQASTQTQINLPVSFDATNVNYALTDFGGNASVLGADPTNASNIVAITTKTGGAELWAGTTIGTNAGFASVIPFTASNHKMQVRVYSPNANIPVRLKVEVHGQPTMSVETEAMTTIANGWETLVFNFDNAAAGTAAFNIGYAYDMASIFFNFGTTGAIAGSKTYYFDDLAIYDATVNVNLINANNILSVYPNPASSTIQVNINDNVNYKIVDLTGRTVITGKIENNNINVNNLSNGVYVLQLITEKGHTSTRFVKE